MKKLENESSSRVQLPKARRQKTNKQKNTTNTYSLDVSNQQHSRLFQLFRQLSLTIRFINLTPVECLGLPPEKYTGFYGCPMLNTVSYMPVQNPPIASL